MVTTHLSASWLPHPSGRGPKAPRGGGEGEEEEAELWHQLPVLPPRALEERPLVALRPRKERPGEPHSDL